MHFYRGSKILSKNLKLTIVFEEKTTIEEDKTTRRRTERKCRDDDKTEREKTN